MRPTRSARQTLSRRSSRRPINSTKSRQGRHPVARRRKPLVSCPHCVLSPVGRDTKPRLQQHRPHKPFTAHSQVTKTDTTKLPPAAESPDKNPARRTLPHIVYRLSSKHTPYPACWRRCSAARNGVTDTSPVRGSPLYLSVANLDLPDPHYLDFPQRKLPESP